MLIALALDAMESWHHRQIAPPALPVGTAGTARLPPGHVRPVKRPAAPPRLRETTRPPEPLLRVLAGAAGATPYRVMRHLVRTGVARPTRWRGAVVSGVRAVLLMRSMLNVWLLVFLGTHRSGALSDVLETLSRFLIADGVLACLVAVGAGAATTRVPVWLVPAGDGIFRLSLGALVVVAPGIPSFPLTAVMYLGGVALLMLFDALSDMIVAVRWRALLGGRLAHFAFVAAAVMLFVIAGGILVSASTTAAIRSLLIAMGMVQAVVLLMAAFERVGARRPNESSAHW